MNNPLELLPTEQMAARRRELNRSADALASRERGHWDSEHRRHHDALLRKQLLAKTGTGAAIVALIILTLINCELAAKCFDSTGDACVAQSAQLSTTTQTK
jgi:hypothetical protein